MDEIALFGRDYSRFMRLMELISAGLPLSLQGPVSDIVSRYTNPYNPAAVKIATTIREGLGVDRNTGNRVWLDWRKNHTRFALTCFKYSQLDSRWFQDSIKVQDQRLLEKMVQAGGLILTYHTHHQNTFALSLGIAGCKISPIAATATGSPLYAAIGRYIDMINNHSEEHFRGGKYLFTDSLKQMLQESRRVLRQGELLLSLCDFHQPSQDLPHTFLGRIITPPTGVIRVALQCNVPIYFGMLLPDHTGMFQLMLRKASSQDLRVVVKEYLDYLAELLEQHPAVWQGWEWYGSLECEQSEV